MPVVFWIFLVRLSFLELFGVVLEDVGVCKSDFKIYLPIGFDILGIHCRPFNKCHDSDPVRTNTCAVYDPVCCFFAVARVGLGGPNLARTSLGPCAGLARHRAGLAQGLQIHPYIYPAELWNVRCYLPTMCNCICRCKLTCQTRCAIVGPAFSFRML